jgi:hypothetical protein
MYGNEQEILEHRVVMTCAGCPEAYIVIDDKDDVVGNMSLRYGVFLVYHQVDDDNAEIVYEARPVGRDAFTADEREYFLTEGVRALQANRKKPQDGFEDDAVYENISDN